MFINYIFIANVFCIMWEIKTNKIELNWIGIELNWIELNWIGIEFKTMMVADGLSFIAVYLNLI